VAFKIGNQTVLDIDVGGGTKIESATDKDVVLYPGTGGEIYIGVDTSLTFEGSSPPDEFEGRLKATTLTADREYTLPDHAYLDGAVSRGMIAVLDVTAFPTGDIATYVDIEIARAGLAEDANTTAISDEATTARAAELLLTNNLAAEITRAGLAEDANTLAITNLSVSSGNAFAAADVVVTDAFAAADVVITDAFIAADVVITDAFIAADIVVTNAAAADATAKANTAKSEAISEVTNGAGAAFDTLVEIQNAMATDAELSTAITNVTSAAAATAAADATTKADAALASAEAKDVVRASAASTDATTKADAAVVTANAYTDTAITNNVDFTGYAQESYVDTAEADAIASAEAKDVVRASAAATDATTKADAAQSAAATDATTKADAAQSAAATDATTKADAALASALAADANTTYTAGNGLTLTGTEFTMSGAYTGNFTATGDVTAYSDIRFKHNVKTITNAVDTVNNLRGVMFHKDNRNSTGVIAQEVEAVFPEVVHTNPEGLKSVAYGNIVGLLIEAVKEQQIQITSLKEEINNLKK